MLCRHLFYLFFVFLVCESWSVLFCVAHVLFFCLVLMCCFVVVVVWAEGVRGQAGRVESARHFKQAVD